MGDIHGTVVGVRANLHTFCVALNADPNDQLLI